MSQSRVDEGRSYRERKRAEMGEVVYKAMEARKRKERRQRNRVARQPSVVHQEEYKNELQSVIDTLKSEIAKPRRTLPQVRALIKGQVDIKKVRKQANCADLLELVYQAKVKYDVNLDRPRGIKKKSVKEQLDKVLNIYKKMTGKTSDCTDFEWLKDTSKVIKFIENHVKWNTSNSKNSQLQAISSILIALDGFNKVYKIYSNASISGRKSINKDLDENKLNDNQPVVKWKEIKRIKANDTFDSALIGLYTLLPPRRVEDVNLIRLSKTLDKEKNILLMKDGKPAELIYNVYKTAKTYKSIRIKVPGRLSNILKKYIVDKKLKDGDYLFGNSSNFSAVVSAVFGKYIPKKISVNTLRHSYISMYLSKPRSIADKKHIGRLMGHGIGTQAKYMKLNLT